MDSYKTFFKTQSIFYCFYVFEGKKDLAEMFLQWAFTKPSDNCHFFYTFVVIPIPLISSPSQILLSIVRVYFGPEVP